MFIAVFTEFNIFVSNDCEFIALIVSSGVVIGIVLYHAKQSIFMLV